MIRKCFRCGNEFEQRNWHNVKFCSTACSNQNSIALCVCKTCGNEFKSKHVKKYCSKKCTPAELKKGWDHSSRKCNNCGNEYTPKFNRQKYCCRKCNPYKRTEATGFYQSKEWKSTKSSFVLGFSFVNGVELSNRFCVECFRKTGQLIDKYAIDHIVRIRDGGSKLDHNNLQSLCRKHHQSKSAKEGNIRYEKQGI